PACVPALLALRSAPDRVLSPQCSWKSLRSRSPLQKIHFYSGHASGPVLRSRQSSTTTPKKVPAPQTDSGSEMLARKRPASRLRLPLHPSGSLSLYGTSAGYTVESESHRAPSFRPLLALRLLRLSSPLSSLAPIVPSP